MDTKPIIEAHGREEQEKFEPTTLEQVWGHDPSARYSTTNQEEYQKQIESMTRSELEAHARLMGVVIVEHTPRLRDKLLAEFAGYIALARKPISTPYPNKPSEAALRVLAEGK